MTKSFENVLKVRSEVSFCLFLLNSEYEKLSNVVIILFQNLKKQSDRKEQFVKSGTMSAMSLKGPKPSGQMGRSILLAEESDNNYNSETVINMDTDAKNQYKQQLLLMDEQVLKNFKICIVFLSNFKSLFLRRQDKYISERANAMESIEQTIVDLGSIYQQLATLIKEQDEVIQRFALLFLLLVQFFDSIYF